MKTDNTLKELREKLDSELRFELEEMQKSMFDMRFKSSSEGVSHPHRIAALRRDIARIRTLLTEREKEIRGSAPKS